MHNEQKISELAEAFSLKMQEALTVDELQQARELNRVERFPGVCHTHDFCDANMVMADAWQQVVGGTVNADIGWEAELWNKAWDRAKDREFFISGPSDSWAAWDPQGYDPVIMQWLLDNGFSDSTWHNDVAPSFTHEKLNLRLWIYEEAFDVRESPEPRFSLVQQDEEGQHMEDLGMAEKFDNIRPLITAKLS